MNIEINLLPEELRPRPPVETRTLLVIVLILALAGGCYFLYQGKSDTDAEIADLENDIAQFEKDVAAITSNPEALALKSSISKLETVQKAYNSFVASKRFWGNALERAQSDQPKDLKISGLTQDGNTLVIDGTAVDPGDVASYERALENKPTKFTVAGLPKWSSPSFTLIVAVAPGGEE